MSHMRNESAESISDDLNGVNSHLQAFVRMLTLRYELSPEAKKAAQSLRAKLRVSIEAVAARLALTHRESADYVYFCEILDALRKSDELLARPAIDPDSPTDTWDEGSGSATAPYFREMLGVCLRSLQRAHQTLDRHDSRSTDKSDSSRTAKERDVVSRRGRRERESEKQGWVYVSDAVAEYDVPKSTLHSWVNNPELLPPRSKKNDSGSGEVLVQRQALEKLLIQKKRLRR